MKRFTATEKWDKSWFQDLTLAHKCLWQYLCDNCDAAGVWDANWRLASFQIGPTFTAADLAAFGGRLEQLPDSKVWIVGFCEFQYGRLSRECRAQNHVFRCLEKHGLLNRVKSILNTLSNRVSSTLQEKDEDKEEDKDTDRKGEPGETHEPDTDPDPVSEGTLRSRRAVGADDLPREELHRRIAAAFYLKPGEVAGLDQGSENARRLYEIRLDRDTLGQLEKLWLIPNGTERQGGQKVWHSETLSTFLASPDKDISRARKLFPLNGSSQSSDCSLTVDPARWTAFLNHPDNAHFHRLKNEPPPKTETDIPRGAVEEFKNFKRRNTTQK